jgi:hypothetical protein
VEEVSAHAQWFYAAPTRNPTPEPVKTGHRLVRLLRRRSIMVEDEPGPGTGVELGPREGARARLSARPRSIVNDNDSSDDEDLDMAVAMRSLRT